MPIPSYHEMLPAPSPFGSLPTSLEVPKDSAPAQAADIRRVASAVLGVGEYLDTRLTTAESDKITGNGAPPAGGYTPTTRPIILKGTGLKLDDAPLVIDGNSGDRYPSLTTFASETRDFLNIHVTDTAVMAFSLFLGTLACIASGTITGVKKTWIEMTLPIGAVVSGVEVTWAGNITGAALTAATYEVISIAGSPDVNPTTFTRAALSAVVTDTHAGTFLAMNTQDVALTSGSFTVDVAKRYFVVVQHYYDSVGCQSEIHRVRATLTPAKIRPR